MYSPLNNISSTGIKFGVKSFESEETNIFNINKRILEQHNSMTKQI
jgi:hypothetical protein